VANCSGGAHIADCQVVRNPFMSTWRVILKMVPPADTNAAVDLRCSLQQGTNNIGETWVYQWSPH
jgi:glucan biosynthesis protein